MGYRGFLLDADNTIFDFDRAERESLEEALGPLFPARVPEQIIAAFHRINSCLWLDLEKGRTDRETLKVERFRRLLEEAGLPADPRKLSAFYIRRLSSKGCLLPHAREVLASLSRSSLLALVTNGISEVQRGRIARARIAPFFKEILISEEIGLSKPDPRVFHLALERLGVNAGEVLCVGDSLSSDIRGAREAGIPTCLYAPLPGRQAPPGEEEPDFIIRDLRELLAFQ